MREVIGTVAADFLLQSEWIQVIAPLRCDTKSTHSRGSKEVMLHYALRFLVVALVAGFSGLYGVAGVSVEIARILIFLLIVQCVISLIMGRRAV